MILRRLAALEPLPALPPASSSSLSMVILLAAAIADDTTLGGVRTISASAVARNATSVGAAFGASPDCSPPAGLAGAGCPP